MSLRYGETGQTFVSSEHDRNLMEFHMPSLMTIPQVQKECGISRSTVYRLIKNGELKPVHIGRSVRLDRTDVEEMVLRFIGRSEKS